MKDKANEIKAIFEGADTSKLEDDFNKYIESLSDLYKSLKEFSPPHAMKVSVIPQVIVLSKFLHSFTLELIHVSFEYLKYAFILASIFNIIHTT